MAAILVFFVVGIPAIFMAWQRRNQTCQSPSPRLARYISEAQGHYSSAAE